MPLSGPRTESTREQMSKPAKPETYVFVAEIDTAHIQKTSVRSAATA